MKKIIIGILALAFLSSCVSKKKYNELEASLQERQFALVECMDRNATLTDNNEQIKRDLDNRTNELTSARGQIRTLEEQIELLRSTNTNLLNRLEDLSIVSKSGAESIKRSLDQLDRQSRQLSDLTTGIQRRDSLNLQLVMNLKRSLDNFDDKDIQVEVKKGVVYVSISDQLLFRSGSAELSARAREVLGKVAQVLKDHKDIEILVEGHTDTDPISTACVQDNWDLSVLRATSVVRHLTRQHNIAPNRLTAGGRSEFVPKATNETRDGKAQNRRTEIIITPLLDQFFNLLTTDAGN
jgi:chemotaxis protein MotB